jgi:hypothetical protein|tara:strand:+ start:347 stop:700 length:354 start_codon:yes stop_codon:yes gene_type:complete
MATLIPSLTLSCADGTTDLINFSVVDSLNVTQDIVAPSKIKLTTSDLEIGPTTYGKSYVYLKNTDDTIAINIEITDGNSTMQLAAGEFAFFPWTGASGIVAFSASGTPYLEYAIFEA